MHEIMIGRIWDTSPSSVFRVLVDRLWPRGIAKVRAPWDEWIKEVAPSSELRQWYGHNPERFGVFWDRYWQELTTVEHQEPLVQLVRRGENQPLMLLTATKEIEWSHLPILRDFLLKEVGHDRGE